MEALKITDNYIKYIKKIKTDSINIKKKEVSKVNQQNYEMSGEEAEMAEMQDDEGVDTIGAERKSIYQKALLNRQEG